MDAERHEAGTAGQAGCPQWLEHVQSQMDADQRLKYDPDSVDMPPVYDLHAGVCEASEGSHIDGGGTMLHNMVSVGDEVVNTPGTVVCDEGGARHVGDETCPSLLKKRPAERMDGVDMCRGPSAGSGSGSGSGPSARLGSGSGAPAEIPEGEAPYTGGLSILSMRNGQREYINPEYAAELAAEVAAELAAEVAAEADENKQREAHNARSRNEALPEWVLLKGDIRERADTAVRELQGCTDTQGDIEDLMDTVIAAVMMEATEKQLRVVGSGCLLGDMKSVMEDLWNEEKESSMCIGQHTVEQMMAFLYEGKRPSRLDD